MFVLELDLAHYSSSAFALLVLLGCLFCVFGMAGLGGLKFVCAGRVGEALPIEG